MNKTTILPLAAIAILGTLAGACTGGADKSAAGSSDEITDFAVAQVFKSADKNYRVVYDTDTAYYDMNTTIQWPMAIGDADISVLRDSLLSLSYGPAARGADSPDKAIMAYLKDPSLLDSIFGTSSITPVDSVPADYKAPSWFNNVSTSVIEMNERMVTYQVVTSSYTGGAHPNSVVYPFTYDLKAGRVLTLDNMFKAGTRDSVVNVIVNAVARQYNVTPETLDKVMISRSLITYPGKPYIAQDCVMFHYNPYDIGPYAIGSVDVMVYPYEIEKFMTPELKSVLDYQPF